MNPLTEARLEIKRLCEETGFTVHPSVPEVLNGHAVVIAPGDTWVQPLTLNAFRVDLRVHVFVNTLGSNDATTGELEDSLWRLGQILVEHGYTTMQIDTLQIQSNNGTNLATASIPVSVKVTQEGS